MLEILQLIKLTSQKLKSWWVKKRQGPIKKEVVINLKIDRPAVPPKQKNNEVEERFDGSPLLILPTNSIPTVHHFMNNNKNLMYGFLFKEMRKAVKGDWPFIELFRVGSTPLVAKIESADYEKSILDMQNYFAQTEDFKKAAFCTKLLDRNRVNQELAKLK